MFFWGTAEYYSKGGYQGNFKPLHFLFTKKFYTHEKHKTHISEQKQKTQHFYAHKKHLRRRKIACLTFCTFCAFYGFYAHKKHLRETKSLV